MKVEHVRKFNPPPKQLCSMSSGTYEAKYPAKKNLSSITQTSWSLIFERRKLEASKSLFQTRISKSSYVQTVLAQLEKLDLLSRIFCSNFESSIFRRPLQVFSTLVKTITYRFVSATIWKVERKYSYQKINFRSHICQSFRRWNKYRCIWKGSALWLGNQYSNRKMPFWYVTSALIVF